MQMPTPATASGVAGLAAILDDPAGSSLVFDYDGTLAPIVEDPERALPHPQAVPALARLAALVGSVAIITGRPAGVVVAMGRFADDPALAGLAIYGHYGSERWDAATGRVVAPPPSRGVAKARDELPGLLARSNAPPGVWVEDKGSAVAVHTRRADDPEGAFARLRGPVADLAARHNLLLEPGRLVLELRPPGVDKGQALRRHVADRAATAVAYAGDDLGDLSAFATLDTLHEEGLAALKICSGSTEVVELARRADLVVDGPSGVVEFIDAIADALESGSPASPA